MKSSLSLFVLITAVLFCSCSIQKRHYMKGYDISFSNVEKDNTAKVESSMGSDLSASIDNNIPVLGSLSDKVLFIDSVLINSCYDELQLRRKKIKGIIIEINSNKVIYDSLLNDGKTKRTYLKKRKVRKIKFCGGTEISKSILSEVKIGIVNRAEMIDSLFWNKYHYDIVFIKIPRRGTEKIKGHITGFSADTVKYIPADSTPDKEIVISTKNVLDLITFEKETISKYEIQRFRNKITSNEAFRKYAQSVERKEPLLKDVLSKSIKLAIPGALLPGIGVFFASKSIKYNVIARKILRTSPELKKYKSKYLLCNALGIYGFVLSLLALYFGVIIGLWFILFYTLNLSLL